MTRTAILTALMLAALTAAASPELYLRGTCTGWDALESHKFHATANPDTHTLHLDNVYGEFKIADANFSSAANFGGFNPESDDNLTVGEGVWQLVSVAPNFIIPQMNDVYFTVDRRNPAKITLTISHDPFVVPETHVPEFSDYYLRGNLHGHFWECDNSLRFIHTGLENVYQLRLAELHGDFRVRSRDLSMILGAGKENGTVCEAAPEHTYRLEANGPIFYTKGILDACLTLGMTDPAAPTFRAFRTGRQVQHLHILLG